MFGFKKKCIVCNKEIPKGTEINPPPDKSGVSGQVFYEQSRLRRHTSNLPSAPQQVEGATGGIIKKYGVYFCCPVCVGMYEKMLEDAKKMDLKNCC